MIEVKVKVRHFCEHHGIDAPDACIMQMDDGTWFTEPDLRLDLVAPRPVVTPIEV